LPSSDDVRDLSERVVVVTGAGSGLGRCLALEFARAGARVHGIDLDAGRATALQAEAEAAGLRVTGVAGDCSDCTAVDALAARILAAEGRVDVLACNAGVCVAGRASAIPLDDWRWITDVNWWATVHPLRAFLPGMVARGSGHVVTVASMAGMLALPGVVPYCATKAAVVGLSESLAIEVASAGVGVTVVCTGSLRTRVLEDGRIGMPSPWRSRLVSLMARWARPPESVARKVVRAVRRNRRYVVLPGELWPLRILRRVSRRLYVAVLSRAFARPLRAWRAADEAGAGPAP
jgi:NAD(P)-dependent dehydrogenase (short-subunit alcohol dehydrogenase family)